MDAKPTAGISERVKKTLAEKPETIFVIRGDRDTNYADITSVLDSLKAAGAPCLPGSRIGEEVVMHYRTNWLVVILLALGLHGAVFGGLILVRPLLDGSAEEVASEVGTTIELEDAPQSGEGKKRKIPAMKMVRKAVLL